MMLHMSQMVLFLNLLVVYIQLRFELASFSDGSSYTQSCYVLLVNTYSNFRLFFLYQPPFYTGVCTRVGSPGVVLYFLLVLNFPNDLVTWM